MSNSARLKASPGAGQEIEIRLTWKKRGFFKRVFGGDVDIDLGCYYQLADGKSHLIDALQFSGGGGPRDVPSRQGCFTAPPYIWHAGNNLGTEAVSAESLIVNAAHLDSIRRLVVYAFVFEGKAKWGEVNVELSVTVPGCEPYRMSLGRIKADKRFCTLAEINVEKDGTLAVKECVDFFDGHADCDSYFGWGFKYRDK